jgi:hypothetical protein
MFYIGNGQLGNFNHHGTPGVLKICTQKCLLVLNKVMMNVKPANTSVTAMFPVKLAPNGKNGIKPIKLLMRMKKKIVNKNGKYLP